VEVASTNHQVRDAGMRSRKVGRQHGSVGIQQDRNPVETEGGSPRSQGRQFLRDAARVASPCSNDENASFRQTSKTAVFDNPVDASRLEADGDIQTNDCRGMIRVYSELLVEENKRRRRQNWSPGALFDLPGWW